jgi:hypothetical protein
MLDGWLISTARPFPFRQVPIVWSGKRTFNICSLDVFAWQFRYSVFHRVGFSSLSPTTAESSFGVWWERTKFANHYWHLVHLEPPQWLSLMGLPQVLALLWAKLRINLRCGLWQELRNFPCSRIGMLVRLMFPQVILFLYFLVSVLGPASSTAGARHVARGSRPARWA